MASVYYEWAVEHVDEHEDIHDVLCEERLAVVLGWMVSVPEGLTARLVLVRSETDGRLLDRSWAYVDDGVLPAEFDCGRRVPVRFQREFAKHHKAVDDATQRV